MYYQSNVIQNLAHYFNISPQNHFFTCSHPSTSKKCYACCMKEFISHFSAARLWEIPHFDIVIGNIDTYDDQIIDITVDNLSMRYKKVGHKIHTCKLPLPRGAVRKRGSALVASPELVFLQLAGKLDMHRLILLGLQMCSHPTGSNALAVTSSQKLSNFIKNASGHRGHSTASYCVHVVPISIIQNKLFCIILGKK